MPEPRTKKTRDERASELECSPELVPVVERLDLIIALLTRLPMNYSYHPIPSAESVLRDLFPEFKIPTR